ncbi:hypothetical protein MMC11_008591 [Xylographa trunciseda]|nr:hypothetical protein [Xylographa trunciseda]
MSPLHFVPPGQYPPFAIITSTDQAGKAIIATAIGLSFVLFCLLIRTYVRTVINGPWGRDDSIVVLATGFCAIQSALVFSQASNGLGKSLELVNSTSLLELQEAAYASNIFFILILYLSKASVVLLILRLTRDARHRRTCTKILAGITLWAVAAIFMITLQCDLNNPWITSDGQCSNLFLRWMIISTFDIFTELILFAMPLYLISALQMPVLLKVSVVLVYGLRLLILIAIGLRLYYIHIMYDSLNATLDVVPVVIWTQIELAASLMTNTIPCFRPFMVAANTSWGGVETFAAEPKRIAGAAQRSLQLSNKMISSPKAKRAFGLAAEEHQLAVAT